MKRLPVRETKCATCPFREGSPYSYLRASLEASAVTEASRICHSTGSNNAIFKKTGKPEQVCRGARDFQLEMLAALGFLDAPTDEAWERKWQEINNEKTNKTSTKPA